MDVRRLLLALHPRGWRRQYGEEFLAFLEQVDLRPAAIADVAWHALTLHASAHRRGLQACAALAISAVFEVVAVRSRLTANVLWAPTTPARALALAATVGPWLALMTAVGASRLRRRRAERATHSASGT
jgi:hypothetical protein